MSNAGSQGPVVLGVGCTAEHNTCGSCKFFYRANDGTVGGNCNFKLPPQIQIDNRMNEKEYVCPPNRVTDSDFCDFWKHSGKVYIVQRKITPP